VFDVGATWIVLRYSTVFHPRLVFELEICLVGMMEGYWCFEVLDGIDVRCYYIILHMYVYIYYILLLLYIITHVHIHILFILSYILFLSSVSSSPLYLSFPFNSQSHSHLFFIFLSSLSPPNPSPVLLVSLYSRLIPDPVLGLTPHVLSEWMVEVCAGY
jgi:hypothetical protein